MKTKISISVSLICLLLCSCGDKSAKTEALSAHNVTEKVKEDWSKVLKPLEIIVPERDNEELETIGSLSVWIDGINENNAVEFHYDGTSFKPLTPVNVESSVRPKVFYPFKTGISRTDTLMVQTPLPQYLTGKLTYIETKEDKIIASVELQDLTALLRFRFQSDDVTDVLKAVKISGKCLNKNGIVLPFKGEVISDERNLVSCEVKPDKLLNNGQALDFHLFPTDEGGDIDISIVVGSKSYQLSTIIPPLRKGSITELRLKLNNNRLTVGSSWVDTKHPFIRPIQQLTDSVQTSYWLQKDGLISPGYNDNCIAIVIETDGKHGKAVALADVSNPIQFIPFRSGIIYETVDGKEKEGCYRGNLIIENEELIEFSPSVKYSDKCAFGLKTGSALTKELLNNSSEEARKLFTETLQAPCGYIPSLYELAQLSAYLISKEGNMPEQFIMPEGFYMSVCESGEDIFYSLNPITCRITAYNSKKYLNIKQRMFYLF